MSRFIVVSDIQYPYQDPKALRLCIDYIGEGGPWDGVLIVGDELDAPQAAKFSKGYAAEFAGTLQRDIDGCHAMLADIVEAASGSDVVLMRSNHTQRIETYLNRYAPALSSLRSLDYPTLLGLGDLGIAWRDKPWKFTSDGDGWYLAHGDEGSLIQSAGGTGLNLARRFNTSVVCGHSHRLGLQHAHAAVGGKVVKRLWGFEVGHLMDMKKAGYLGRSGGGANWQQGFGIIEDGFPIPVPIINGKAVVRL